MPRRKKQLAWITGLIPVILLTANMVYADTDASSPHTHPAGETKHETKYGRPAEGREPDRIIVVTADDINFSPASITVTRGKTIQFIVSNRGKLMHEFVLGTANEQHQHHADMSSMSAEKMAKHMQGLANGIMVPPGETQILTWTFDTSIKEIQFSCNVPGHIEAGMYGPLDIEDH